MVPSVEFGALACSLAGMLKALPLPGGIVLIPALFSDVIYTKRVKI